MTFANVTTTRGTKWVEVSRIDLSEQLNTNKYLVTALTETIHKCSYCVNLQAHS